MSKKKKEWSTSLVSAENRALLLRTRPPRPFTSNSGDPDLLRSSSLPNFRSSNKPPSPRIQLEPLDLPPAESLDNGAGKTIFDRKSPRTLRSFLANYLSDDFGSFKVDIDLQRHQQESGQPTTNVTIQECCDLNPGIRSLNISRCNMVTDVGLWAIARYCTTLRELKVAGCDQLTHVGLRALSLRCTSLELLDFHDCPQVDDLALRVLAGGCWKLRHLNLQRCQNVSDAGICEIAQMCNDLQVLNVSECRRVGEFGDKALLEIGKNCKHLQSLDLFGCKHVRDAGVRAMASGCHKLHTLKLTGCVDVTGAAVRALAKGCTGLKTLSLSGCEKIKNRDLWVLASAATGITSLDISGSPNIKSKGIQALTDHCKHLTYLNISSCAQITDSATDLLAKNSRTLQFLNLAQCPKVTETGIDRLTKSCTRLFSLNLTDNSKISRPFLQSLVTDLLFVEWAHGYYGFQPKPDAEELIKRRDLFLLQTNSASAIQRVMRGCLSRGGLYAVKLKWTVRNVLPKIQAKIRGALTRKHLALKIQRRNQRRAALRIQRIYRGYKGRERARVRKRVLLIQGDEGEAAIIFQKIYRGHVDRVRVRKMQEQLAHQKMLAARREALETMAVVKVQQRWRGHKGAAEVALLQAAQEAAKLAGKEREVSARRMQTIYRGKLGRQQALDRRAQLAHERQEQGAALSMQRIFRGHQGRAEASVQQQLEQHEKEEQAALIIQVTWRGMRGRHFAAMMKSLWQLRQREDRAARRIQRVYRGMMGRRAYAAIKKAMEEKRRRERAALCVQRIYRGHAGRTAAEVRKALRGLDTEAAPMLKRIAVDEARLRAAAAELAESDRVLKEEQEDERALTEEIDIVKQTQTKYHDSRRITGHPQRFLTKFLAMQLNEQLAEKRAMLEIETEANEELFKTVKSLERAIRATRRELAPLQQDITDRIKAERSARLRATVRGEHQAAILMQRVYRGHRVRVATQWKANYWEEKLDDITGEIFYHHKWTGEDRRTYPHRPLDMILFEAPQRNPNWEEEVDDRSGLTFYYNKVTEEHRWSKPVDFESITSAMASSEVSGADWFEDQDMASLAARSETKREIGFWQEMYDPESKHLYYMCAPSGDLKWSLPPRTAHTAPRIIVVESEEDESDEDEDAPKVGGEHIDELLMEWGIPDELREDALRRPKYYNLNAPQMLKMANVWDGPGHEEFKDMVQLALGLKPPKDLERQIRLMDRMMVPFFEREMMVREIQEACGEQDWERALAIVQQVMERQREAGERPPEMITMSDDSSAVKRVMEEAEQEAEEIEKELEEAARKADRRAAGLPSDDEAEQEEEQQEESPMVDAMEEYTGSEVSEWQEAWDDESGAAYWTNSTTGESSWEPQY